MMLMCESPDASVGIVQRMAVYLDCQGKALGENGFQALAGGPLGTALLSAVVTLFVAVIGYRLVFGEIPNTRDGVGWVLRLGMVLALVTSWPTFQTLVYRVAVDGPQQISSLFLGSTGLPADRADVRLQRAYDILRVGIGRQQQSAADENLSLPALETMPKTATLLIISTVGLQGAVKMAIGLLLALSPVAFMALLFNGTIGLFSGWLRVLTGFSLGLIGATIVTASHLLVLEGEISRQQILAGSDPSGTDAQAITTIVTLFALIALVVSVAGMWMASALKAVFPRLNPVSTVSTAAVSNIQRHLQVVRERQGDRPVAEAAPGRAVAVARALSASVHREQRLVLQGNSQGFQDDISSKVRPAPEAVHYGQTGRALGPAGRRMLGKKTVSANRRDKLA